MSTLRPLIESSSSERARLLLRAARADGPRPSAAGRTLSALGVVGTTAKVALATGGAAAPVGASAVGSSGLAMIAAKWALVGMLGGGALASGAALVFSEEPGAAPPTPAVLAPLPSVTPTPAVAAAPAPGNTVEEAPASPAVSAAPKLPSASSLGVSAPSASNAPSTPFAAPSQAAFESPEKSKLLHDIALLDDARRALRAGNPGQAKAALGRYESERLTHVLDREAQLTRIDVLTALGERALARQLAIKYVATFPNDAYVGRLQTLINDGK